MKRDSQVSRVYKAELQLRRELKEVPMSEEETVRYVNKITNSRFFLGYRAPGDELMSDKRQFKSVSIKFTPRVKSGWAYAGYRHLTLPVWARIPTVILHELSHHVTRSTNMASHGPEFVRTLYDMLGHYLPPQVARRYKELCKENRVKMARRVSVEISTPEEVMPLAAERSE